jgi:hypothetical protein
MTGNSEVEQSNVNLPYNGTPSPRGRGLESITGRHVGLKPGSRATSKPRSKRFDADYQLDGLARNAGKRRASPGVARVVA